MHHPSLQFASFYVFCLLLLTFLLPTVYLHLCLLGQPGNAMLLFLVIGQQSIFELLMSRLLFQKSHSSLSREDCSKQRLVQSCRAAPEISPKGKRKVNSGECGFLFRQNILKNIEESQQMLIKLLKLIHRGGKTVVA